MAEERSENTNSSLSSRKRQCNSLLGNGDTTAAISSTDTDTKAFSRTNMHQQKIISDIQTKLDTVEKEKEELKQRCTELTQRNQELEIKVKDLTLKNEYNEWSYTAEDISASYWIERGFAEDEYVEREEFISKLKEYTNKLRRGEPLEEVDLFTIDHMLHDDILLPHWKEFADALEQYQKFNHREDYGIKRFRIDDVQLQQEVLNMISPALQTLQIKKIAFGGNIGSDVIPFISNIIQHNPYIENVGWRNQIESVDDMRHLCNSIKNRDSNVLKFLGLYSAFDGNNSNMMKIMLEASHHLKKLSLYCIGIGSESAHLIANFLASNPSLDYLDLRGNNLSDADMPLLANALQSNTILRQIDLVDNNDIGAAGTRVLLQSVFDVSSLNSCAASNRVCIVRGLNPNISYANIYSNFTMKNRAMKIFTMLSATDNGFFNIGFLGDVPYKLIPRLLRLVQKFTVRSPGLSDLYFEQTGQTSADWDKLDEETVPITSMFELLRGWAVPSLP